VLSLVLWNLKKDFSIYLLSIEGGSNHNAIPREAYSDFLIQKKELSDFKSSFNKFLEENENNFIIGEPEISFELKEPSKSISLDYIPLNLTSRILDLLFLIPNGVISMHPVFKDTVLTSINLAKIESKRSKLHLELLQRGFNQFEIEMVYQKIESLLKLSSLDTKVKHIGGYKEWISDLDSNLLQVSKDAYIEIFKTEPVLKLVHAGIECGVFKSKIPKLELLAFGAEVKGAHSPDEILSIESVSRMWELTLKILDRLNN
jgi:dipeptidase D